MEHKRLELAIYGKGGIGKSTICANLSAALAQAGKRVLQIGCDPKHDSTRLLLGGGSVPTVLDFLKQEGTKEADAGEILGRGYLGIGCIEAGGPKPGVGCAGRGIISAFEFLEANHSKETYDMVLYDVLGDVVCGGFAVPIRRTYANAVYLVTSGEFMAIYAANNILRGILNYDGAEHRRVAGILYNSRNIDEEYERVRRFAEAVRLPICASIPRSGAFARAEEQNRVVMAMEGCEREKEVFSRLAEQIIEGAPLFAALPLEDQTLEDVVLRGRSIGTGIPFENSIEKRERPDPPVSAGKAPAAPIRETEERASAKDRPPLYGCAFNGAITTAVRLSDAVVIAHSPRSCAFYTWQNISSPGRKNLFDRGILMPSAISPNFESTQIGQNEVVFGGMERLREQVSRAIRRSPGAVIVVSSCVSGIIGDDIRGLEEMSTPQVPVLVIPADGDIGGDYMEGIRMCLHTVGERLIGRTPKGGSRSVNLIGEVGVSNNIDVNYRMMRKLLGRMEIGIGCRFLGGASVREVRNLLEAPLNILASGSADNLALKDWLEREYGCVFLEQTLPIGFAQTRQFLEKIAAFFHCEDRLEPIIAGEERRYREQIRLLREKLQGKKLLLTTISTNMDWLIYPALEAGMELVWCGVLDYLHQGIRISDRAQVQAVTEEMHHMKTAQDQIKKRCPDIVVSNYTSALPPGPYLLDNMGMTQTIGFHAGTDVLKRWTDQLEDGREGAWIYDRALYQKYFA